MPAGVIHRKRNWAHFHYAVYPDQLLVLRGREGTWLGQRDQERTRGSDRTGNSGREVGVGGGRLPFHVTAVWPVPIACGRITGASRVRWTSIKERMLVRRRGETRKGRKRRGPPPGPRSRRTVHPNSVRHWLRNELAAVPLGRSAAELLLRSRSARVERTSIKGRTPVRRRGNQERHWEKEGGTPDR